MALHRSTRRQFRGINAVRGTQRPGNVELARVDIHSEDSGGFASLGSLDDGETHGTQAEDGHAGALLDVAGLPSSAQTSAVIAICRMRVKYTTQR